MTHATQADVLKLQRRLSLLEGQRSSRQKLHARNEVQVYRVVAPIKPGERGSGVLMHYSFEQVGSPLADEGWVEYSDDAGEKADNEAAAVEILDSEYQTLAMPDTLIRGVFYKNAIRTIGEYGIANVRVKAIADYTNNSEGEYQIIDGGPQIYDGSPVTIKATLPKGVFTDDEFLFSYDRVAREWYEVETGGESGNWVEGYANAAFDTADTTITITATTVIRGDSALVGTNISMPNPFPFSGASERTYAGVANCYIQAMQADDGTWRLIEISPTKCLCEDVNNPGSGTP